MVIKDLYENNKEVNCNIFQVELFYRYDGNSKNNYNPDKPCCHLIGLAHTGAYGGTTSHVIKEWDSNKEDFTLEEVWNTKIKYEELHKEYQNNQQMK